MLNILDFKNSKVYPFKGNPRTPVWQQLCDSLDKRTVEGLCLEFGVFKGLSINVMDKHDPTSIFWGFDSFEGLPENWVFNSRINIKKDKFDLKGEFPEVEPNVRLVKGWYNESLPNWLDKRILNCNFTDTSNSPTLMDLKVSFIHIDCDIYSSTKTIFDELNPFIVGGTIIVFDELCDWRLLDNPRVREHSHVVKKVYHNWKDHEWKALNEWVKKYNRSVVPVSRTYGTACTIRVTN